MLTGVCESYDFINNKCNSGEELTTINLIPLFFDLPSILLISIITILGSAFRGHGLIGSLEKASHLAKDVGELEAAIRAIHTFMGVFNESAISVIFCTRSKSNATGSNLASCFFFIFTSS